tara:strand:- start:556 stop:684 length:129 start_codon:yes stop_codon:yes gene_type:complete
MFVDFISINRDLLKIQEYIPLTPLRKTFSIRGNKKGPIVFIL